jgi:hypothetical protein
MASSINFTSFILLNFNLFIKKYERKPTLISLGDTQFRVLSCKVLRKKILPERSEAWRFFFVNPKGARDLAGQAGHGITFAQ